MRFGWSAFSLLTSAAVMTAAPDEPSFLKRNEVIALVGGEEMLAVNENGQLELLLTRALPAHRLRFRDLAWEGDTVFEQHRDLNYPTIEQQLETIGATLVIAQFGQMESLAGPEGLAPFVAALEKMTVQLTAGGKRRLVLVEPTQFEATAMAPAALKRSAVPAYRAVIKQLATRRHYLYAEPNATQRLLMGEGEPVFARPLAQRPVITRDGVHLRSTPLRIRAESIAGALLPALAQAPDARPHAMDNQLREMIAAKNRLWFHYRRPQNWAFLAGDRVTQPSSHDYRDPAKRWFPGEMEQFLPLIAAAEQEIWKIAANASP
jgi:hypothetical protein